MENMSSATRIILKETFESKVPVLIYSFHERYLLSPFEIDDIITKYVRLNVLQIVEDSKVQMTAQGQHWIIENRNTIFIDISRYWKELPPTVYAEERIEIGKPCLPNFKNIDKRFFRKLAKSNQGDSPH